MKLYNHNNPSKRDDDFGSFVERQLQESMVNNALWSFREKKKILLDPENMFEFIQHPTSYKDSKILCWYFFNGKSFEEPEEDFFTIREFYAYLIAERGIIDPEKFINATDFNWEVNIELFLNWRGY